MENGQSIKLTSGEYTLSIATINGMVVVVIEKRGETVYSFVDRLEKVISMLMAGDGKPG